MAQFTLTRRIDAPPEVVFDTITDHRAYSSFTPLRRSELEREGEPAPNGVGAVRVLGLLGPPMRERIVTYERPGRFAYELFAGLPIRDHRGTVTCAPSGNGTLVTYHLTWEPASPLIAPFVAGILRVAIISLLRGAAAEAERRAAVAA